MSYKKPIKENAKEPSGDKEPRRGFLRGHHLHTYSDITKNRHILQQKTYEKY